MAIYEITADRISPLRETSFDKEGILERWDLQRLLRNEINIILAESEVLIIAEEFSEFEDSKRRIDLLGLDKDANLVLFELKRTEDGGEMDLQAIRYAAMVSRMTFDKAVEVYGRYLVASSAGQLIDPRAKILEFLGWDDVKEDNFAQDVRIVLLSADFSRELTTAVLWLNERDLDIRCLRMKPYSRGNQVLVDIQQIIPLPEATDYMVRIREKEVRQRGARKSAREALHKRFWSVLLSRANVKTNLHAGAVPSEDNSIGIPVGVAGLRLYYALGRHNPRVELYIDAGDPVKNKSIFDLLFADKDEIEKRFGIPLVWERMDDKRPCRIRADLTQGSVQDEHKWNTMQDEMVDQMVRLERALRPELDMLRLRSQ